MNYLAIALIAIGVSMDAFAVSICKGLCMNPFNRKHALVIAVFFGAFQALMPLIGWSIGCQFQQYIVSVDHWVAFGLLSFIGIKMIVESFKNESSTETSSLNMRELFVLSVATSIDALAVGISFAMLPPANVWISFLWIGATTFAFSFAGTLIGHHFGNRYRQYAEIVGGVILIGIGLKILIEHLSCN